MLIGVWVLILAVPGFPPSWRTALLLLTGIGIVVFGYRLKAGEATGAGSAPKKDLPFTDYKRPQGPVPTPTPPSDESRGPVA